MTSDSNRGRPRSFDEAEALESAMRVFWTNGYAGTSYPALEEETGLHRQSLRYAFGDKAQLFERVVTHYADCKVGGVIDILNQPGPALDNIKAVLAHWARDANHPSRQGCLMVNALAEIGGGDTLAVEAIDRANQKLVDALARAFKAAQRQGAVRPELDTELLARQAVALGDGFMLHGRSGSMAKFAEDAFRAFVSQIAT